MIDQNVVPQVLFKVIDNVVDSHNHKLHTGIYFQDISLINDFNLNEEVLYQEYNTRFPDKGRNERLGRWYGREIINGDKMCSLILNKNNELFVWSYFRPDRITEHLDRSVEPYLTYSWEFQNSPLLEY